MGASLLLEAEVIGARTAHRVLVLHTRDRPFDSPSCVTLETASNVAAAFPSSCARRVVRKETDLHRSNLWTCRLYSSSTCWHTTVFGMRWLLKFTTISFSRSLCFIVRVGRKKLYHCKIAFSVKHYPYFFLKCIFCKKTLIIFACHALTLSHNCGIPSACQTCERSVTSVLLKHRQKCVSLKKDLTISVCRNMRLGKI